MNNNWGVGCARTLLHRRYRHGCAFCTRLAEIDTSPLALFDKDAAINDLFDQADRAARLRRAYGRRHGWGRP